MRYVHFPYEKINKGSTVIIYGAGFIGQRYYKQCISTQFASVIRWVDKNYEKYKNVLPVESNAIDYSSIDFDYLIVAIEDEGIVEKVKDELTKNGVPAKKIIWSYPFLESQKDFKYNLSIAAIAKWEENYIREWIEYHKIVGVKHFYIYDNDEQSKLNNLLADYINDGIVTLIPWLGEVKQLDAYRNAICEYKYENKYIAFIDCDEFIIPVEGNQVDCTIEKIFNSYMPKENLSNQGIKDFDLLDGKIPGGLGINWREYGTSNHIKKPKGLVLENFLYRGDGEYNYHIKCVVNPRVVIDFNTPHSAVYEYPFCCISENGTILSGNFFPDGKCEKLRINHYRSKSEEEMINKVERGRATIGITDEEKEKRIKEFREGIEEKNRIYDPIALRFVEKIKESLNNEERL